MDKNQSIQTLITDWSGVISDDRRPVYESNMRVLEAHGVSRITFDEWLPLTTVSPREFFANSGLTHDSEYLFGEYQKTLTLVREEGINPVVYPNAITFLSSVAVPIVVVSAHPAEHLKKEAEEYGVRKFVQRFVGNAKNKADVLSALLLEEDISPMNAIYMGDTVYDIQAAKKAGIRSVGISTGYHVRSRLVAENPTWIIDSLLELIPIITNS